jgi:hypothetical protein
MTNENPTAGERTAAINFQFPSLASPDWLMSFTEGPTKFYGRAWKESLGFAACALQDQADYVRKLADCKEAAEALKCQWEFAQRSWIRSSDGASKFIDALRRYGWSGSAGK